MKRLGLFWNGLKVREIKASVAVEIILILVVLIAVVAIFKGQVISLVGDIFDKITKEGMGI